MFKITDNKGFHITFENGWTISVQFGPANYCENYDEPLSDEDRIASGKRGSKTAEVAWWKEKGQLEGPEGWQTPAQVLAIINDVASR